MARRKKNDDDQSPDNSPENNDETFGLPEVEYQPLNREEAQAQPTPAAETEQPGTSYQSERTTYNTQETQQEYVYQDDDDYDSSPWPKIIAIVAILALAGGAYWFFGMYQPKRKAMAEKARQEQLAREEADRKNREFQSAEQARLAKEQRRADSLANLNGKQGAIETLTERTRRYYVVIASAIDGDLIMDHAKQLSAKGVDSKIIPPFGKAKFYRLAVAVGDNYRDTQATADGLKDQYGGAIWVIKY
jgi:hypothetical protein